MKRKVIISSLFSKDVRGTVDYIRRDKPIAAQKFKGLIKNKVRSLILMAERGRIVPETINYKNSVCYREIIIGNYRLIYRMTKESVFVLRLIHGHQNISFEKVQGLE